MCGIQVGESNTYTLAPPVGGTLTHACCEYNGVWGRVKSEWRKDKDRTVYSVSVPSNVTVRALLPDGEHILTKGTHEFII